jgi:hypothetical protein
MNPSKKQPPLPGLDDASIERQMFVHERLPLITSQIQAFAEELEKELERCFDELLPDELQEAAHLAIERVASRFIGDLLKEGSLTKLARRQRIAAACAPGYAIDKEAA